MAHFKGCFSGAGLDPLVPVQEIHNASDCQNILENSLLPSLWMQFGEGPVLLQHECAQSTVPKDMVG